MMKLWHCIGGIMVTAALAGCAQHDTQTSTAAEAKETMTTQLNQPAVTGSVFIRQRIALPPDAVVTVTLSDISLADAPSRVISQQVFRTEGKQAPFAFTLPYNPQDIQPSQRIIVSAAITINGRLVFISDTINEVINNNAGTQKDVLLVSASPQ